MLSGFFRAGFLALSAVVITACQTTGGGGGGVSPLPPMIGPMTVNGVFWGNEPLTVYFSDHGALTESAGTVAMNDLYFTNRYAFQVQLRYQFPAAGFEIQENGVALPLMQARTNTKSRAVRVANQNTVDPVTGQPVPPGTVLEWGWPLPPHLTGPGATPMKPRGVPPPDKSSYSIELINTCAGRPNLYDVNCANPDTIILLTISPPVQPAPPVHGKVFEYKLVEKGTGSRSGETATTPIKAIYIQPRQCAIRSLIVQPMSGKAGDLATVNFETVNCRRVSVNAGSKVIYDDTLQSHAGNVNDSRPFLLPKQTSVVVKLTAWDAMQVPVSRSVTVEIDPCSISPTHTRCEVNCTARPNDPRCPPDCTVTPNDPRCATRCPRTTANPDGELKAWETAQYCGTFHTFPVTIYGCTFEEAQQTYPPNFGCVYTTITGEPVGECMSGLPKQNFEICLSCAQGSATPVLETAMVADSCSVTDASEQAIDLRKPRTCTFISSGRCPCCGLYYPSRCGARLAARRTVPTPRRTASIR
jgi:hypothetical protein